MRYYRDPPTGPQEQTPPGHEDSIHIPWHTHYLCIAEVYRGVLRCPSEDCSHGQIATGIQGITTGLLVASGADNH